MPCQQGHGFRESIPHHRRPGSPDYSAQMAAMGRFTTFFPFVNEGPASTCIALKGTGRLRPNGAPFVRKRNQAVSPNPTKSVGLNEVPRTSVLKKVTVPQSCGRTRETSPLIPTAVCSSSTRLGNQPEHVACNERVRGTAPSNRRAQMPNPLGSQRISPQRGSAWDSNVGRALKPASEGPEN